MIPILKGCYSYSKVYWKVFQFWYIKCQWVDISVSMMCNWKKGVLIFLQVITNCFQMWKNKIPEYLFILNLTGP